MDIQNRVGVRTQIALEQQRAGLIAKIKVVKTWPNGNIFQWSKVRKGAFSDFFIFSILAQSAYNCPLWQNIILNLGKKYMYIIFRYHSSRKSTNKNKKNR